MEEIIPVADTNLIRKGFDRDIDFGPMKEQLITEYTNQTKTYLESRYVKQSGCRVIYILIALIQLRNGSRISEAVNAFKLFMANGIKDKVIVKIAKSSGPDNIGTRYRKMMFPDGWIDGSNIEVILNKLKTTHSKLLESNDIRKNVLTFMLRWFESNTHSLRYAFINHMIYEHKQQLTNVAKFVGHKNLNQLVTYTQHKNCEKLFDMNI